MNGKEIATRLRKILEHKGDELREDIAQLIVDLDPIMPAAGTPILWRQDPTLGWKHAVVEHGNYIHDVNGNKIRLSNVQWKPARVAGENEVVVNREDLTMALHINMVVTPDPDEQAARRRLYAAIKEPNDETA